MEWAASRSKACRPSVGSARSDSTGSSGIHRSGSGAVGVRGPPVSNPAATCPTAPPRRPPVHLRTRHPQRRHPHGETPPRQPLPDSGTVAIRSGRFGASNHPSPDRRVTSARPGRPPSSPDRWRGRPRRYPTVVPLSGRAGTARTRARPGPRSPVDMPTRPTRGSIDPCDISSRAQPATSAAGWPRGSWPRATPCAAWSATPRSCATSRGPATPRWCAAICSTRTPAARLRGRRCRLLPRALPGRPRLRGDRPPRRDDRRPGGARRRRAPHRLPRRPAPRRAAVGAPGEPPRGRRDPAVQRRAHGGAAGRRRARVRVGAASRCCAT